MSTPFIAAEQKGHYSVTRNVTAEEIVAMARSLVNRRFNRGKALTSPNASRDFLVLHLAELEQESFACLFLDNQHRIIAFEELFRGTIDGTSVV
jgi:DNA repair protein RadC